MIDNTLVQEASEPISPRISQLRERLVTSRPEVFAERAILMTRAYRANEDTPMELCRAQALAAMLDSSSICISPGELVVGCKTPIPKGSPVYPEFNVKWLETELDTLANRVETPFDVSDATKSALREEVLPYWQGKTIYDRILEKAPGASLAAADEGLFFHYYIDRSIGHISVNYEKVLKLGIAGLKAEITAGRAANPDSQKTAFYDGLEILADAVVRFARRYAGLAEEEARKSSDPARCKELERIAANCRKVPEYPAETLHEALQSFWFVHLILNLESNSYAISPGRFCQYIYPFYQKDLEKGLLDRQTAQELVNCLWIKFNEMTVVKAGATAKASNTYVDFQNLNIGGLMADGQDGTNEISYCCLDALDALNLPQPQLSCLISSKTDASFLERACQVIRGGTGMPAMFNQTTSKSQAFWPAANPWPTPAGAALTDVSKSTPRDATTWHPQDTSTWSNAWNLH